MRVVWTTQVAPVIEKMIALGLRFMQNILKKFLKKDSLHQERIYMYSSGGNYVSKGHETSWKTHKPKNNQIGYFDIAFINLFILFGFIFRLRQSWLVFRTPCEIPKRNGGRGIIRKHNMWNTSPWFISIVERSDRFRFTMARISFWSNNSLNLVLVCWSGKWWNLFKAAIIVSKINFCSSSC